MSIENEQRAKDTVTAFSPESDANELDDWLRVSSNPVRDGADILIEASQRLFVADFRGDLRR